MTEPLRITNEHSEPANVIDLGNGVSLTVNTVQKLFNMITNEVINMKPFMQRALNAWTFPIANFLRKTMIESALYDKPLYIPPLVYYKYHLDQLKPGESWQMMCLDGGNRSRAICAFIDGVYMNSGTKEGVIPPCCELMIDGEEVSIFFNNLDLATDYKKKTKKRVSVLTETQQNAFLGIKLGMTTYTNRMNDIELGQKFLELQNCVKVTGSDILKLKVDCPLVQYIKEQTEPMRWQDAMLSSFKHVHNDVSKYWLPWCVKFYLMLYPKQNKSSLDMFTMNDKTINEYINENNSCLQYDSEKFENFKCAMHRFFSFMNSLLVSYKVSLTAYFAIFYVLSTSDGVTEETLRSNIKSFISTKDKHKRMWVGRTNKETKNKYTMEDLSEEYEYLLEILLYYNFVRDKDFNKRMRIPTSTKLVLEVRQFGDEEEAICPCCNKNMIFKKSDGYHRGHIKAHAHGGTSTPDNLLLICKECNLNMDVEHLFKYQERCFPEAPKASDLMRSFELVKKNAWDYDTESDTE